MRALFVLSLAVQLAPVQLPPCPPTPPTPGAPVWFEFQVEEPALFRPEARTRPYPDPSLASQRTDLDHFALVQFIVDTTGVPRPTSLRFLRVPPVLDTAAVRIALSTWRYTPARAKGCLVPQLVQTPLRWEQPG